MKVESIVECSDCSEHSAIFFTCIKGLFLHRSRKFCQRGFNSDIYFFLRERGSKDHQKRAIIGLQQNASEMADNGRPWMLTWQLCVFQGIRTSIAKKTYKFVIFQGGGGGGLDPLSPPPSGSACNWSWKSIFGLFDSGRFTQVLL